MCTSFYSRFCWCCVVGGVCSLSCASLVNPVGMIYSFSDLRYAVFIKPLCAVYEFPTDSGKGRGYIAAASISAGSRVLTEPDATALQSIAFRADQSIERRAAWLDLAHKWLSLRTSKRGEALTLCHAVHGTEWINSSLTEQERKSIDPARWSDAEWTAALIQVKSNGFIVSVDSVGSYAAGAESKATASDKWLELRLSPHIALTNHSCAPNSVVCDTVRTIRALRPIARGEEITICYNADNLLCDARERRKRLGFWCCCVRCAAADSHSAAALANGAGGSAVPFTPSSEHLLSVESLAASSDGVEQHEMMIAQFENALDNDEPAIYLEWLECWSAALTNPFYWRLLMVQSALIRSGSSDTTTTTAAQNGVYLSTINALLHARSKLLPLNCDATDLFATRAMSILERIAGRDSDATPYRGLEQPLRSAVGKLRALDLVAR